MEQEVRDAVERYVEAVRTNNPALVKVAFAEDAVMWGYLGPDYVSQSAESFADDVIATAPPADPAYSYEIHSVEAQGNIASATLDEKAFLGADFRNIFGLVKVDGVWRIVSKVFTTL